MAQIAGRLTVRFSWWVQPYLTGVILFARTFGMEPDLDKVTSTVMRGVRVIPAWKAQQLARIAAGRASKRAARAME